MKITLCMITLNEEGNLERCLQSCEGLVDEVVVVDSGSVDRTRAIAESFGARVEVREWLGFVGQKNRALELAGTEWVLSLDADEELSGVLRREIGELRGGGVDRNLAGYSMPRCVLYEGRWIRHGDWYPDRLVRLFRRGAARFAGGRVHERLEVEGRVGLLSGEIHHYSFRDRSDHWARCEKYARLWAETQREAGREAWAWEPWSRSVFRWFRGYVLRGGFLDGRQGWAIALMNAREVRLKYELLRRGRPGISA